MIDLGFTLPRGRSPEFLFLGAHSDDIEIGCGGTAIELLRRYPRARVHWVVFGARGERVREARRAARLVLGRERAANVAVRDFRDGFFPADIAAIKEYFEELKRSIAPDVIFTHQREDLHQDHRVVAELTWNTWRNHFVLEYEIPKYDGGLGSPSAFVPLRASTLKRKCEILERAFATQRSRRWFTTETFMGLARLRGIECNAPEGYAEAFYARKVVLATGAR